MRRHIVQVECATIVQTFCDGGNVTGDRGQHLHERVVALARRYPVITLTGPRQSGKTTLCRAAFPDKAYLSLEPPDEREFARTDPRGYLARVPDGAVIDEVQRAPELLSYIQPIVDAGSRPGQFVLTGSLHFGLLDAVTQTLAGRTAT